jgi:hypothetical protein
MLVLFSFQWGGTFNDCFQGNECVIRLKGHEQYFPDYWHGQAPVYQSEVSQASIPKDACRWLNLLKN